MYLKKIWILFYLVNNNYMKTSPFLQGIYHAYAQTNGAYSWPNNREGDLLKEAKREI